MIYILDGVDITNRQFITTNGTSYPYNWCNLATPEEILSIGIISLTEVWPSLDPGNEYNGEYIDDFIGLTRTYEQSPIPPGLSGTVTGDVAISITFQNLWCTSIAVKCSTADKTVKVGVTVDGNEILDTFTMVSSYTAISMNYFLGDAHTIYITGPSDAEYSYNILVS